MTNTNLNSFTLNKVKVKGNGLDVGFEVVENTAAEIYHDQKQVKSDKTPHPDLLNIFKTLRGYVAQVFYFSEFASLVDSKAFEPTEKQVGVLQQKYKDLQSKITVTGVGISGKDDNLGIIITAKLTTESGHEVAINTQRIKYTGTTYGFEEELEDLMADLEGEAFEYVINGKQAQLEMAFSAQDGKMAAANDNGMFDDEEIATDAEVAQAEEALNAQE